MRKVENVPTGPNHKPKIPVILFLFLQFYIKIQLLNFQSKFKGDN